MLRVRAASASFGEPLVHYFSLFYRPRDHHAPVALTFGDYRNFEYVILSLLAVFTTAHAACCVLVARTCRSRTLPLLIYILYLTYLPPLHALRRWRAGGAVTMHSSTRPSTTKTCLLFNFKVHFN